nr:RNase adapter RapZ [Pseudoclavibacter sp. Marseille-Q3772]
MKHTHDNDANLQEVTIVTGMSGAGRSTAIKAFEDLGWYVVDNLPPEMIRPLMEVAGRAAGSLPKLTVAVDIRGGKLLETFQDFVNEIRKTHVVHVLFLDATEEAIVRRYESSRRPHPLQRDGDTVLDAIRLERERLREIRSVADVLIDTSELNVHQLAHRIRERFAEPADDKLQLTLMSFGFKYGSPQDADLVVDMRFLPNPFWSLDLRPYNGRDKQVSDFVLAQEGAEEFSEHFVGMLEPVIRGYERENKRHALIGIGCTGGKHRSVAMTEHLANKLRGREDVQVSVRHRDLGRE